MEKKWSTISFVCSLAIAMTLTACNLPSSGKTSSNKEQAEQVATNAAKTVVAEITLSAPAPQATPQQAAPTEQSPTEAAPPTNTAQPPATATEKPQPTASPTITQTPTPEFPVISAKVNTNCRAGAAPNFKILGYLLVGETSYVHAKDPWGYWWYIENPDHPGKYCWIWRETTEVTGDTDKIPVKQPPPTYTPTPTDTPSLTPTITDTPYP